MAAEPEFRQVSSDHPDAQLLVEQVQAEYVLRYGSRDETPVEHAMFEPPQGSFFVAYLAGQPVGSGAWRRHGLAALGTTETAEIKRMYVVPSARGQGVARRMLAQLESSAAATGVRAMILETGTSQPEAMALYQSSGYQRIEAFGHHRQYPNTRCFAKLVSVLD